MIVLIATEEVAVKEAADFDRLKVDANGQTADSVVRAFRKSGVGSYSDSGALISTEFILRAAGEQATSESWLNGFRRMLAYARTRGWVSEDGGFLLVHVENLSSADSETSANE